MTDGPDVDVDLDTDTCVGSTWCTTAAPRAFVMGADGKARVGSVESATRAELQEAEESCPVSAIRVLNRTSSAPATNEGV